MHTKLATNDDVFSDFAYVPFVVCIKLANGVLKEHRSTTSSLSLGRAKDNDVVIKDRYISRHHATVEYLGNNEFLVTSLKDYNGVIHQGQAKSSIKIKAGQKVLLGKSEFSFTLPSQQITEGASVLPQTQGHEVAGNSINLCLDNLSLSAQEDPWEDNTPTVLLDDDDDEDEDEHCPPSYSMRDQLLCSQVNAPMQGNLAWELIRHRGESIFACHPVPTGESCTLSGQLTLKAHTNGQLFIKRQAGTRISLADPQGQYSPIQERLRFNVLGWAEAPSTQFTLELDGILYSLRKKRLPNVHIPPQELSVRPRNYYIAAGLFALHMMIVFALGLLSVEAPQITTESSLNELNRFATVAMNELAPMPTPIPKAPEPVQPKLVEPSRKPTTKAVATTQKHKFKVQTRQTSQAQSIPDVTQVGALGKLGGTGLFSPTASATSNQLVAAVSNVSAVRAHGGIQTFSVSGNIGGMPGKDVRLARITDVGARGGTPLGNGFGAATVGAKTNVKVKGLVVDLSPPPAEVGVRGGGLTREEIAKVVQQHLSEIRYCYEKGLLDDTSLSGKIQAHWTIAPTGRVAESGIKSSSVRHASVHQCLIGLVRTWQFPKPRNQASVLVTFPFVFNSSNF